MKNVKKFNKRKVFKNCNFITSSIPEEDLIVITDEEGLDNHFHFNIDDRDFNIGIVEDNEGIKYIDINEFIENPVYIEEYNYRFYADNKLIAGIQNNKESVKMKIIDVIELNENGIDINDLKKIKDKKNYQMLTKYFDDNGNLPDGNFDENNIAGTWLLIAGKHDEYDIYAYRSIDDSTLIKVDSIKVQTWGKETGKFLTKFFGDEEYKEINDWEYDFTAHEMFNIEDFKELANKYNVNYRISINSNLDNIIARNE